MLYFQLAWRNLWRNRRRTLITVAAVFFAGFLVMAMRMLQLGTYDNMIRNTVGSYGGFVQVHALGYWDEKSLDNSFEHSEALYERISGTEGISGVSPRLTGFSLVSEGLKTRGVQVEGFDPDREAQLNLKDRLVQGAVDGQGVIIGSDLADFLKAQIGDSLIFIGQGYHGMSANALLPISGIVKLSNPMLNGNTVFLRLDMAQYLFAADGLLTSYAINLDPDVDVAKVTGSLSGSLDTSAYEVMDWQEMMPELVQAIEADSAGGILMSGVLYIVISFSLLGTFIMLAAERKREYGMLIGLGMRRSQLMIISSIEALFMAVMGSLLAILITRPVAHYFHHHPIQYTGQAMEALKEMGMEASMPASVDWSIQLTHGGILILLTFLISVYALVVIRRLKPVAAMRS